ncbi:MAG: SRPBCC family protein [Actinomycetota bacterium]
MRSVLTASTVGALAVVANRWAYRRLVTGDLVMDLSIGRTIRPLGPIDARIEAPRELVFDVIAAPYLASPPSSLAEKIQVLERSDEMVLASHHTPVREGLVATTVETVRFERPGAVYFRLLRGPVPHVIERFELAEDGDATLFHYEGELGADLWALGRLWGDVVARRWEAAVRGSVAEIRRVAEIRAARHRPGLA